MCGVASGLEAQCGMQMGFLVLLKSIRLNSSSIAENEKLFYIILHDIMINYLDTFLSCC